MKKTVMFILLIALNISSLCFAFEPPNSDRYYWLGSDDKVGIWVDTQTIRFQRINGYPPRCNGHRSANAWTMYYSAEGDYVLMTNGTYDLDCRKNAILSVVKYSTDWKVIDSFESQYPEYKNIVPGSVGEAVLDFLTDIWRIKNAK